MTSSRFIRDKAPDAQYVAWRAPEVHEERGAVSLAEIDPEAHAEQVRQQAFAQGLEEGRSAGLAAGQQQLSETIEALERVLNALARPLEEMDIRVEEEIVALVTAICGALVRRELKLDPSHIIGILREGLAALPLSNEEHLIRLHPEDADAVREYLASGAGKAWRIEADPVMERGGCVIRSGDSQVDGRLETRLGRVVATMLEGERSGDERV